MPSLDIITAQPSLHNQIYTLNSQTIFHDIVTAQPSLHNQIYTLRSQTLFHGRFTFGKEKRLTSSWKSFPLTEKSKSVNSGRVETWRCGLMIKAVATLEPTCSAQSNDERRGYQNLQMQIDSTSSSMLEHQSSSENSTELAEREKLRRMRISKANKGNTPWNLGRKHSPETLQRIRERTRLAMQDPKVKMKLVNLGHAQSEETRIKIGVGVRMGWKRRHEKLILQETCHLEWQNLIAESSRKGFVGEEELQWDSYKILDKQLEQEWLESVEQRKNMPRTKGSKRAPKSPEQRKKIAQAIAAKWADPVYRDRVYSGLSKYHGTPVGAEKKPKRRRSSDGQPRKPSPPKKNTNVMDNSAVGKIKSQNLRSRPKRNNIPLYKDPLASSKLEMIKNIRAQRATSETKKAEAITRAKLLITEAEKAAKALESAAIRSPVAQSSLIETRKLIAEAIRYIESIETGQTDSDDNGTPRLINHVEEEAGVEIEDLIQTDLIEVNGNGTQVLASSESAVKDFDFGKLTLQDILNGKDEVLPVNSYDDYGSLNGKQQLYRTSSSDYDIPASAFDGMIEHSNITKQVDEHDANGSNSHGENLLPNGAKSQFRREETSPDSETMTRKWVRGRLIEVAGGG